MRWQTEAMSQGARRHLGFETHWQWSELAIWRSSSALFGPLSLVTLFAHRRMKTKVVVRSAWYDKEPPDILRRLALVRGE